MERRNRCRQPFLDTSTLCSALCWARTLSAPIWQILIEYRDVSLRGSRKPATNFRLQFNLPREDAFGFEPTMGENHRATIPIWLHRQLSFQFGCKRFCNLRTLCVCEKCENLWPYEENCRRFFDVQSTFSKEICVPWSSPLNSFGYNWVWKIWTNGRPQIVSHFHSNSSRCCRSMWPTTLYIIYINIIYKYIEFHELKAVVLVLPQLSLC